MLAVRSVTKRYGSRVTALDNVSFEVDAGQVMAVIGANGAGKTTLIKCIVGLVRFEGEVVAGGIGVSRDGRGVRRLIGYMPQDPAFHSDLTVRETALFYADLKSAPPQRARELVETVGLAAHEEKKVGELSGGMRQRLALAVTLLANPPLLVLDEPASGLDPEARIALAGLLKALSADGMTLLVSSHILAELAEYATHLMILDAGRVISCGPLAAVSRRIAVALAAEDARARPVLAAAPGVSAVEAMSATTLGFAFDGDAAALAEVLRRLVAAGIPVIGFGPETASLQDVYLDRLREGRRT